MLLQFETLPIYYCCIHSYQLINVPLLSLGPKLTSKFQVQWQLGILVFICHKIYSCVMQNGTYLEF